MVGHHSNGRAMGIASDPRATPWNRHGFLTCHGGRAAVCCGQVTALRDASADRGVYVGWRFSSIQSPVHASVTRSVEASTMDTPVRQNETAAGKLVRGAAP